MLPASVTFLAIALLGAALIIVFERVPPWYLLCVAEPLFHGICNAVQHASAT